MAQGVGSASTVVGSQDVFGGHLFGTVDYKGPKSYVQGGDAVDPRVFGFPNAIVTLIGSLDQSATYRAEPRPMQNGTTAWQLVWTVYATGAQVAGGVDLSGATVRLSAVGI